MRHKLLTCVSLLAATAVVAGYAGGVSPQKERARENGAKVTAKSSTSTANRKGHSIINSEGIVTQLSDGYQSKVVSKEQRERAISPSASTTVVTPPYRSDNYNDGLSMWTLIDANNDGFTWYDGSDQWMRITYNDETGEPKDDWLISVPIQLEKGVSYNITFDVKCYSKYDVERMEVKYGTSPTVEGMTNQAMEPFTIDWDKDNPKEMEAIIAPAETGVYYIGFHAMSDANKWILYLGDFAIKAGKSATSPAAPTNLTVTADPTGKLKTTVTMNAPTQNLDGSELTAIEKIELKRDGVLVKTFDNPTPGASLSFNDELRMGGEITYTATAFNEVGAGATATAETYVGYYAPSDIEQVNVRRGAEEGSVIVDWTPITHDSNGIPYSDVNIAYTVYLVTVDGDLYMKGQNITDTTFSFVAVEEGDQQFVQCAVVPMADGTRGNVTMSEFIPVGTPYNGFYEDFSNGQIHNNWLINSFTMGEAYLMNESCGVPSQDGDKNFVGISSVFDDAGAEICSGLISLKGMTKPALTLYTYDLGMLDPDGEVDVNEVTVYVRGLEDKEYTTAYHSTVDEACKNGFNGWGKITVDLSKYGNGPIEFKIKGMTYSFVYTFFDNIRVGSLYDQDLRAGIISAPYQAKTGETFDVEVKVLNEGDKTSEAFDVELYKDGKLADTKHCASIIPGELLNILFSQTMSPLSTEAVVYTAKVVSSADSNDSNNESTAIEVQPVLTGLPSPTDLAAQVDENSVTLSWNAPDLSSVGPQPTTYDFEDGEPFGDSYHDFIFIDRDELPVNGFSTVQLPGFVSGSTKGSFWIWDNTNLALPSETAFATHSGNKMLFALNLYDEDAESDDWAISPELYGGSQEISFFARSYSKNFPNTVEVYYSTGSTNPDDFILIPYAGGAMPAEFTQVKFTVPEGAKRFAIRNTGSMTFALFVDDITMITSELSDLTLEGFNVYRDGVVINDKVVTDTQYTDAIVDEKAHTYVITSVYKGKGESLGSNVVMIGESGVKSTIGNTANIRVDGSNIVVTDADNVTITSASGMLLYNGKTNGNLSLRVSGGIYIVKAGSTVRKVIVK